MVKEGQCVPQERNGDPNVWRGLERRGAAAQGQLRVQERRMVLERQMEERRAKGKEGDTCSVPAASGGHQAARRGEQTGFSLAGEF